MVKLTLLQILEQTLKLIPTLRLLQIRGVSSDWNSIIKSMITKRGDNPAKLQLGSDIKKDEEILQHFQDHSDALEIPLVQLVDWTEIEPENISEHQKTVIKIMEILGSKKIVNLEIYIHKNHDDTAEEETYLYLFNTRE